MADENGKPKPKKGPIFYGGILLFIGGILLLMSFSSPYWLQSYEIAYLDFKNMGLWEFCFFEFRFPNNQLDHKFTGCHYVFSDEYRIIREWMLPAWLQVVQALVSLAFVGGFSAQIVVALMLMRWPLGLWRRFQLEMTVTSLILAAVTGACLFLAVAIFGAKCWDRDWLMYPNYNYLSWAYYMAIFSLGFHALAALFFSSHTYRLRQERALMPHHQMHAFSDVSSVGYQYGYPSQPPSVAAPSPAPYQRVANDNEVFVHDPVPAGGAYGGQYRY